MRRRRLLRLTAGAVAVAFAGCAGSSGDGSAPATPTTTATAANAIADRTFAVTERGCGQRVDTASLTFGDAPPTVTVDGTIHGSDATRTARVQSVSYDAGTDHLDIVVGTTARTTGGTVGAQCLVEIDYDLSVTFTAGLPGRVTVGHDHGDTTETVVDTRPSRTDDSPTDDQTETSTTDDREGTTTMTDGITTTFTVTDSGCGQQVDETNVAFDASERTVTVTGTIHGSDLTKTARLRGVSYDADADRLTVTVETARETTSTTVVGGQCIVEVDYEATVGFADSLPGEVAVVHDSAAGESTVATVGDDCNDCGGSTTDAA